MESHLIPLAVLVRPLHKHSGPAVSSSAMSNSALPAAISYAELPPDWAKELAGTGFDLTTLYGKVDAIYRNAGPNAVSPTHRSDVFRAFHKTPLDSVRFIVLGEDPYPDPDQAHGVAFSVPSTYKGSRPASLGKIFGSLRRDLKVSPTSDDLTPWADRGVLLLNVALTHTVGAVRPDLDTWLGFTTAVLGLVNAAQRPVAWLLWGDFANNCADLVPVDNSMHQRFENAHPTASRAIRPLLSHRPPFAAASAFLGSDPILDWIT